MPAIPHRVIWLFALAYMLCYMPYAALVKTTSRAAKAGEGAALLPVSLAVTVFSLAVIVTLLGWWKHWRRPAAHVVLSGIGAGLVIATTTLAYTFSGVSVIFALLLMRGGVLILAPLVDLFAGRRIRWFAWAALITSIGALVAAIATVPDHRITTGVMVNLAGYLCGYVLRLPSMTHGAKVDDPAATRCFFVQELVVASAVVVIVPALLALSGVGALRRGYTDFSPGTILIGCCYATLYVFGTLIYLDRRENTFCVPLNRAASLLAGVLVMFTMQQYGFAAPLTSDLVAAMLILVALMFLSPLHHIPEWMFAVLFSRRGAVTTKEAA